MLKKTKYILVSTALTLLATTGKLNAQADSSVYHESVIVVGDYKPVLDGVGEKVNVAPSTGDNIETDLIPKFNYDITPRRISPLTPTTGIKAAKVIASPTRLYDNYIRFGLGHDFAAFADFNPLADLYYMSTRKENFSYGVRLFHETDITTIGKEDKSTPSPDYYGRHRQSDTRLDLFGKYILNKKHLFSASAGYDRQFIQKYGISDSTLFANVGTTHSNTDLDIDEAYNNLSLKLAAKSLNTDTRKLGYDASVFWADFWTKSDYSQLSMDLDATVHYGFPIFSKFKGIAAMRAEFEGFRQHCTPPDTTTSDVSGRHLFTINPYVDFLFKDFKIHAGLALGFNGYDNPDNTKPNLFPDITVTKSFNNNTMSLNLGFKGAYIANDWNQIRLYNPFVTYAPLTYATLDNNLFAHFRINFSKKLILNIGVDNHFYSNKMFFMLQPEATVALGNTFIPYFMDVNNMTLSGDFTFVNDEMITLTLGGEYYLYYNKAVELPLYHTPDFTIHLDADVNYKDKWFFDLSTLLVGRMDAYYIFNTTTGCANVTGTIPAYLGLKISAEYRYSRALSFFAKFDNLTFQRYFLWANYPAQRFNALLGLTYTFPHK